MMDFYQILDQVIDLLRQRGRVTYRALKDSGTVWKTTISQRSRKS